MYRRFAFSPCVLLSLIHIYTTIFMVTHDSFAASFCDRVIILKDGEIFKTAYCSGSHRDFQKELLEIIEEMGEEGEEKE